MRQPPWMAEAWRELGQKECAGPDTNRRIAQMFADVGAGRLADETPWCAAFVGACLERAGVPSTRSLSARSYLDWGIAVAKPEAGAIVVLSRGADPALGHVGFLVGATADAVVILGGNQSDAVGVAAFDRARVLACRLPSATSAPDEAGDAIFGVALAHVLDMEGGWTNDPYDPGGPTNKGITLGVYAASKGAAVTDANRARLIAELRAIPDAEVRAIYRTRYWLPARAPELPAPLAIMHFDAAVNQGVGTAVRMLQEALGVEVDGEIGPATLAAARRAAPQDAVAGYGAVRRRRYESLPHFWRFGRGWLRRVDATVAAAARLKSPSPPAPSPSSAPSPVAPSAQETPPMSAPVNMPPAAPASDSKWWGHSMTIWGALMTAFTTVLPLLGSALGVDLTPDLVQRLGQDIVVLVQAIGGLVGTIVTIIGRARASSALMRRPVRLQL